MSKKKKPNPANPTLKVQGMKMGVTIGDLLKKGGKEDGKGND